MSIAECPNCGAKSTYRYFSERPDLNETIPDECHYCKREAAVWSKNSDGGIDVTQFGGRHMVHGIENIMLERKRLLGD